jgi:hypothetical protein
LLSEVDSRFESPTNRDPPGVVGTVEVVDGVVVVDVVVPEAVAPVR